MIPIVFTSGQRAKYVNKLTALFGGSIVALWPQNESAGTVARDLSGHAYNGAYTGVTLGAAGIGDGNTAASFHGTTSFNNVYSAGVAAAFNGAEGTVLVWEKVSGAGVWTDATARAAIRLFADANNFVHITRTTTNNQLQFQYAAGGTFKVVNSTALGGLTSFIALALTWSKSGDAVKVYGNGSQFGSTLTGLGTWAGALLSTACCIGANSTAPAAVMSGTIGPVLLLNRAATASEILAASTL